MEMDMAEVKRKITVELSADDMKEAVRNWLNGQPEFDDHYWDESNISISVGERSEGYGTGERIKPYVRVIAEN